MQACLKEIADVSSVERYGRAFAVLVEGDDHNEPIAERGRDPAINVLTSVSRTMPACVPEAHRPVVARAGPDGDLCRHGGVDPSRGISCRIERRGGRGDSLPAGARAFLTQARDESLSLDGTYAELARILGMDESGYEQVEGSES